jgi:cytoskeletal protein CcmA (bactofilin family)
MYRGPAAARTTSEKAHSAEPSEQAESVLGRGARVRGRVGGEGDLRVEGQVEGDVRITGNLSLEDGATITGDVEAASVVIGGALTGDVAARGSVTIRSTAYVEGNMGGAEVVLEEGASFTGRIEADVDLSEELGAAAPRQGKKGR